MNQHQEKQKQKQIEYCNGCGYPYESWTLQEYTEDDITIQLCDKCSESYEEAEA